MSTDLLYTIPFSHYCEKARWALQYAGLPFEERGHLPALNRVATARFGGSTVPLLVCRDGVLKDSTDIVAYADRHAREASRRLLPDSRAECDEVLALEERFDRRMGVAARAWVYTFLLAEPELIMPVAAVGVSRVQSALISLGPVQRALVTAIQKGLRIGPSTREWARVRIEEDLAFVADRLSDGRRFLVGDRFTAADLTFASLAAPALFPSGYGGPIPAFDALAPAMREQITAWRETRAGEFVLRMYRERRAPPSSPLA